MLANSRAESEGEFELILGCHNCHQELAGTWRGVGLTLQGLEAICKMGVVTASQGWYESKRTNICKVLSTVPGID